MDLNQNMERMFRNLSDFWSDSKRVQPLTPMGAVMNISSRCIVSALWFLGISVAVSVYFFYQIIKAGMGIGVKK
jgi:hypothetical protein